MRIAIPGIVKANTYPMINITLTNYIFHDKIFLGILSSQALRFNHTRCKMPINNEKGNTWGVKRESTMMWNELYKIGSSFICGRKQAD